MLKRVSYHHVSVQRSNSHIFSFTHHSCKTNIFVVHYIWDSKSTCTLVYSEYSKQALIRVADHTHDYVFDLRSYKNATMCKFRIDDKLAHYSLAAITLSLSCNMILPSFKYLKVTGLCLLIRITTNFLSRGKSQRSAVKSLRTNVYCILPLCSVCG